MSISDALSPELITVYLRLIDVPVPSIYGPTADEPMPGFTPNKTRK